MHAIKKEGLEKLIYDFENPSAEYSPIPFWFWNDTLDEEELSRQIFAFKEKGVDGFVIHPRMGLDPEIRYMGEKWLHFVKFAVELAKKLDMKVILYDEAMYPSGSCCGQVVAENPDYVAKGLKMCDSLVLAEGEKLIAEAECGGKHCYFVMTPTFGTIRGVYYGQDDGEPDAPRAADLLNPQAVAAFIRLTHDKYYEALSAYFGETIIAIFTDEPCLQGRGGVEGLVPWTEGFLDVFKARGYSESDLYALFVREEGKTEQVNLDFSDMIYERMNKYYYGQIAQWCEKRGIVLTGHPERSSDIHLLSHFGIPCQDIVWRVLYPGESSSIRGIHSTMGKCASDAARHGGKRRNGNECFGVCGHKDNIYAFERADMKWYIDWLFVRGCNLIIPHAFYYSIRDKRKEERPPEVGMHSTFWNEYKELSDYIKRCSAINTDSVNVTDIAVLCLERFLPDEPVRVFYENQVEFNYLERALVNRITIEDGAAKIANQEYRVIIVERDYDKKTNAFLEAFQTAGGIVIDWRNYTDEQIYLADVRAASKTLLDMDAREDLRITHVRKYGVDVVFLSNEGETELTTTVRQKVVEIWDCEHGIRTPYAAETLTLTLKPRESVHLILQ